MTENKFRVIVKAIITFKGRVLIGKKESGEDEWHLIENYLELGNDIEEFIVREIKKKTGLDVKLHQAIDTMSFSSDGNTKDSLQVVFHCESSSIGAEAKNGLEEVKWIQPENITEYVHSKEAERIQKRESQSNFIEKLSKMPAF